MKVTMGDFGIFLGPYHARVCLFNLKDHYQSLFCYHDPGRGGGEGKREETKKKKKNPVEPKRYLQTHVHSSISHLHPKVEAWLFAPIRFHVDCGGNSQVAGAELIRRPDSRWTDKHSVVHPYDGTLLSFQKEWSSDTCYSMDESENTC